MLSRTPPSGGELLKPQRQYLNPHLQLAQCQQLTPQAQKDSQVTLKCITPAATLTPVATATPTQTAIPAAIATPAASAKNIEQKILHLESQLQLLYKEQQKQPTQKITEPNEWQTVPTSKRQRDSPGKSTDSKRQAKIDQYWLGTRQKNAPETENRFSALELEETNPPEEKQPKPPPIFVDKVSNITPLMSLLQEIAPNSFHLKLIGNEQVKVQASSLDVYKIIVAQLEDKHTEFFTYKIKQDRSFKVVLRNMHFSIDTQEIVDALKDLGHFVTNIWNMKHRVTKKPLSMFIIELKPSTNNKDIYQIKSLLHSKIVFEPPHPKREIPQCAKCQKYGHTKGFCRRGVLNALEIICLPNAKERQNLPM